MSEVRPELQARFGDDPDALEWARGHVQAKIDWLREASELPQAGEVFTRLAAWCAEFMQDTLIGNRLGDGAFGDRFVREWKDATHPPATLCSSAAKGDEYACLTEVVRPGRWIRLSVGTDHWEEVPVYACTGDDSGPHAAWFGVPDKSQPDGIFHVRLGQAHCVGATVVEVRDPNA